MASTAPRARWVRNAGSAPDSKESLPSPMSLRRGVGSLVTVPPDLAEQISGIRWFHHIRLKDQVTPGRTNPAQQRWLADHLPSSFRGQQVLDVGAWDGYFSFLAESRGATSVLAYDRLGSDGHDGLRGFELAKQVLASSVQYQIGDLFDLPKLGRTFDVILFLGVYYHLKNPELALEALRSVLAPGGTVYLEGLLRPGRQPTLYVYTPEEMNRYTFVGATSRGLERTARQAGFESFRRISTFPSVGPIGRILVRAMPRDWAERRRAPGARGGRTLHPRGLFELKVEKGSL